MGETKRCRMLFKHWSLLRKSPVQSKWCFLKSQCFAMTHMTRRLIKLSWKAILRTEILQFPPCHVLQPITLASPFHPKEGTIKRDDQPQSFWIQSRPSATKVSSSPVPTVCWKQYWEQCWTLDRWGFNWTSLGRGFTLCATHPQEVRWICHPGFWGAGFLLSAWLDQFTGSNNLIKQRLF